MKLPELLNRFILQSQSGDLKTSIYPKEWDSLRMKISFGMGMPARIPWISFCLSDQKVSKGVYPVYLYYKDLNVLVLAYGISETEESEQTWPAEIMNSTSTITAYFDKDVPRYGSSFVFRAYKVKAEKDSVEYQDGETGKKISEKDLEADLDTLLTYYKKNFMKDEELISSSVGQGLFYMEKQLEDFIIHNWENTELGKKYDLIIEEGELLSQQYRTDIGPIDILAKDKKTGGYVVIELKRNQTSDDTVGQLARYMGWIKDVKKASNVKGIIIAGEYDKKLDYALKVISDVEVYLYKVDFTLNEFKGVK